MIKWLIRLPLHGFVAIIRYPLAPFVVIFFTSDDKKDLLYPFKWLGTIDNDLSGDSGWKKEHIKGDPLSTYNRIRWLWRNGGNSLNYYLLGCEYDSEWAKTANEAEESYHCRPDGYWQWRVKKKVPLINRYWTPYVGWGLFGPNHGRCKITATVLRFNTK